MVSIFTSHSVAKDSEAAVSELTANLGTTAPDLIVVYASPEHPAQRLIDGLAARYPHSMLQGGTSCLGVMTDQGMHAQDGLGVGLFAVTDAAGAYGVGAAEIADDPRAAARAATESALNAAQRPGEMPALIWLAAAPGSEETLLAGIADIVGPNVPVAGGSTADNDVSGRWQQFCGDRVYDNAVTIAVLFPSSQVAWSFHSGYSPTQHKGRITKVAPRTILEIDGEPAADVYDRWTDGALGGNTRSDMNVLLGTSLHPLGRAVDHHGGVDEYRLSHPEAVTTQGGLRLFTDIAEGDEVVLMTGDRDSLISRAGRVAVSAANSAEMQAGDVAGALVIYCAGCMLTVDQDMHRVPGEVSRAVGHAPFLGAFTFGEQGCVRGGDNHHGNLMISVVLFGK